MKHFLWDINPNNSYRIAILMKSTAFNKAELFNTYVKPLTALGLIQNNIIAFTLKYNAVGKAPVKDIKEYLGSLLPALTSPQVNAEYLYVADANYFKVLTGQTKADPHFGYILPCAIKDYTHLKVVLGVNYQTLIYNPDLQAKIDQGLVALASDINGTYQAPGTGIIHSAQYPESHQAIQEALNSLHQYAELSADIEAFSLRFNDAGVGTIGFAWDQHNGIAFACDYQTNEVHPPLAEKRIEYGRFVINPAVRDMLKEFFCTYKGKLTWHNAGYDLKVLIYTLWMQDPLDTEGLLKGLEVMTKLFDDTKIIAYLATNSTAGNVLGLKPLAHSFAGNWAQEDIKDIRKIPLPELLRYNLVDALSTIHVKDKYYPIMVQDKQLELYETLMLPSVKTLLMVELDGMPLSKAKIAEIKTTLTNMMDGHLDVIMNSGLIKMMNLLVQTKTMEDANAKLKAKQHPLEKFADVRFNPNSGSQLQRLLYELMMLPVLDYTDTKQPATGADTIEKLIHHTEDPAYKELLAALIGYGKVTKILNTFIPAFEEGIEKEDGCVYLHGNFNLGGTVSGRLSSNSPNLQNLPSGSTFGKLVKSCFVAPPGFLLVGADFAQLEDRINALLTKDPNKLKVFTDGFDSHCLRAFYFFPDRLPGITEDVDSINSIKKLFPLARQDAKSPAFAIQYAGTWRTLVKNLGFTEELAKQIEINFHKLYRVSAGWVNDEIAKAAKQGYATTAFGLRIRTPLLEQVVYGASRMPTAAGAEARTLGNAISGQSYGQLNNRAANEFMEKVWKSKHRLDIKPIALIHDSVYLIIKDDAEVVEWANRELIKAMEWQDLPELQHPIVKLESAMDICWPGWHNPITLPNNADQETIMKICTEAKAEYLKPKKE